MQERANPSDFTLSQALAHAPGIPSEATDDDCERPNQPWCSGQASAGAEDRIRTEINAFVDMKLNQNGWTNECWTNTPYQPIYDAMRERYGEEPAWMGSQPDGSLTCTNTLKPTQTPSLRIVWSAKK
jgi:hypothetical protein